jgi:hypothetical protein
VGTSFHNTPVVFSACLLFILKQHNMKEKEHLHDNK